MTAIAAHVPPAQSLQGDDTVTKLKVGVIGCGVIAQAQHLPNLRGLHGEFEIGGIADISRSVLQKVGDDYQIPPDRRFTDYRDLLQTDIDAVVACTSGTHAPQTIAAAEAGKHVLVEKPACVTVREGEAMVEAADRAGVVLMVGYMKRHDPAYRYAQARVARMSDVRFIQVNHLHPDNSLHVARLDYHKPDDVTAADIARRGGGSDLGASALGLIRETLSVDEVSPELLYAFNMINGSMIHDIGNLHGMFGPPARVLSSEIWHAGHGITAVLEYASGPRAVVTWVDLPELWAFEETLEVYGSRERVILSFPTGFSRGLPTRVTVQEIEENGVASAKHLEWHENTFKNELAHFGECIRQGKAPATPGAEIPHHAALVRDIMLAHLNKGA